MAEIINPAIIATTSTPTPPIIPESVGRYTTASRYATALITDSSAPKSFLTSLEPAITDAFKRAVTDINTFIATGSGDVEEAKRIKSTIESDYHRLMGSLACRVTSIAIPTLSPSSGEKALATTGESNQFTFSLPTERILRYNLQAVKADGSLITLAEVAGHADITSYQSHSCGANALEGMLYLLSNPERNLFASDDIEEILSRGITQYEVIRKETDRKKNSKDPSERAIARAMADGSGITADGLAFFYMHKGLEMVGLPVIKTIDESSAQAQFRTMLERLNPDQGILLNIFGRDISVTCKLDAEGNKTYAVFDSHRPYGSEDTSAPAMLSRFGTLEDAIVLIDSRLHVSDKTQMEYSIFSFNPTVHSKYSTATNTNLDTYLELTVKRPLEATAILTAMNAAIATIRRIRAQEAEEQKIALAAYTKAKESAAPAKKEEKLKYRSAITSAEIRIATIKSFLPKTKIKTEAALLSIFERLSKTPTGKAFLNRLLNGGLRDEDCTAQRELIEFLDEVRLQLLIPQAHIRKKELIHIAIVLADLVGFDKRKVIAS